MTTVFVEFRDAFLNRYKGEPVDVHFRVGIGGYQRANHAIEVATEDEGRQLLHRIAFPVLEKKLTPMLRVFDDDGAVRPYEFDGNLELLGPNGSIPMTTGDEVV